jgi:zinc transport system substrate-binding protein
MNKTGLYILLLCLAASCSPAPNQSGKPVISVSILPQQYFVEQLAGNLVEINVLIPPGASPATYEPSISQLVRLDRSVLYMRIGHVGFERSWMDKISSVNPSMKIVDLSQGVAMLAEKTDGEHHHEHEHEGGDPHIWMSAINAKIIARNIHHELLGMFPDQEVILVERYAQFLSSLDSLHLEITRTLSGMENRRFMIYHPALTYFARDYNLEQFSLETEGKSPSPAHLKTLSDRARSDLITKILVQDQFDRKNAEVLARETGAEIIPFDPLSLNWHEQMRHISLQLNPKVQ